MRTIQPFQFLLLLSLFLFTPSIVRGQEAANFNNTIVTDTIFHSGTFEDLLLSATNVTQVSFTLLIEGEARGLYLVDDVTSNTFHSWEVRSASSYNARLRIAPATTSGATDETNRFIVLDTTPTPTPTLTPTPTPTPAPTQRNMFSGPPGDIAFPFDVLVNERVAGESFHATPSFSVLPAYTDFELGEEIRGASNVKYIRDATGWSVIGTGPVTINVSSGTSTTPVIGEAIADPYVGDATLFLSNAPTAGSVQLYWKVRSNLPIPISPNTWVESGSQAIYFSSTPPLVDRLGDDLNAVILANYTY